MVRAPCCEKMGLKKGPWTPEEDQILIAFIQRFGHGNWRALPKQAGLLRCGKSCRLRWTNYLRPDIKRGAFSREEEETIIKLHELLGNRWSTIAARLPGRTDNEIKNVWHTHLKKRLNQNQPTQESRWRSVERSECDAHIEGESKPNSFQRFDNSTQIPLSPEQSPSYFSSTGNDSSVVTSKNSNMNVKDEEFHYIIDNVCSEVENSEDQIQISPFSFGELYNKDSMDFWVYLLTHAGDLPGLPEI